MRRRILISWLLLSIPGLPDAARPQEQFFVDETVERMPARTDRSEDGDLGDLNGDGYLDFVISNGYYGGRYKSIMRLNAGDGTFRDSTAGSFPPISEQIPMAVLFDYERDGDLDVYMSADSDRHYLLANDGAGDFTEVLNRLPTRGLADGNPAAGDVTGDLFMDLVVPNHDGHDRLYRYLSGYYVYAPESRFPAGFYRSHCAAMADVDGDLDLDVLIGYDGTRILLLVNDGRGFFDDESDARMPDQPSGVVMDFSCFDADGDGDLDIFASDPFARDRLFINDGAGRYVDETLERLPSEYAYRSNRASASGDIDNDGDLDLVIARGGIWGETGRNRVWINDGTGHFTDGTSGRLDAGETSTTGVLLGDLDNDGDLDLISLNWGPVLQGEQNRLFVNENTPDTIPPVIARTTIQADVRDTLSPYPITTMAWDNISVNVGELKVTLHYRSLRGTARGMVEERFLGSRMVDGGGYLWRGEIPAQRDGRRVEYYVRAVDRMGNVAFDPPAAPDSVYTFQVEVGQGRDDGVE